MNNPLVTKENGPRPAGRPDRCFYCKQLIGEPHTDECVLLVRTVKVRYSFEIEINVPHHWDKGTIEDHRNRTSWCADNALSEIENYNPDCACSLFNCEVLDVPEMEPFIEEDK